MAVALYFIDVLALRAGHEKEEDEADTVGCCTLKVRNAMSFSTILGFQTLLYPHNSTPNLAQASSLPVTLISTPTALVASCHANPCYCFKALWRKAPSRSA